MQVSQNKTVFGVITDGKCILNELGRKVEEAWLGLGSAHPACEADCHVVMPNHLSYLMRAFKGFVGHEYTALAKSGRCPDIGHALWQESFYDRRFCNHDALVAVRRYIRDNPARWEGDRFGPVTGYSMGPLSLLRQDLVGDVASESQSGGRPPRVAKDGAPVISTFTSPFERDALGQCLALGRPFVAVLPGGIPERHSEAWDAACTEGRGLFLSPVPPGTGVNKKRAIWCNQYVIRYAVTVYTGFIRPGGILEGLCRELGQGKMASGSRPGGAASFRSPR